MYRGRELDTFALARNWKRYFASILRPYVSGRVLEIGAGIGETTGALWNERVTSWTCLEPDPTLAQRLARQWAGPRDDRVPEVFVGTVADLDAARRFDAILYIDVLEHIEDDRAELARAATLLAPGGRLAVLSPAHPFLFSPFDAEIGHHRRYTASSLAAVAPAALEREALLYADSVGLLLSLANRVLLKQDLPSDRQILIWDRVVIRASRVLDPLLGRRLGRSVIGVFQRPAAETTAARQQGADGPVSSPPER